MAEGARTILLGHWRGAEAAALLTGTRLEDLLIDPPGGDPAPRPGEIYWAKADRAVPKMGGLFVRLTPAAQGFLREGKGVRAGAGVLVQVTAYPEGDKAVPVTRRVLHKGPRLILTPDAPGINVSRRIGNTAERERLVAAVGEAGRDALPEGAGVVIRTSARGAPAAELAAELAALAREARAVSVATRSRPPLDGPAAGRARAALAALREWSFPGPARIVAARAIAEELLGAVGDALWGSTLLAEAVEPADADPIADAGVAEEIEALFSPRVPLPSGGWMAVEPTAALVAVDVNTGGEFSAGSALTANLEAVRELPRQLRLRGLGGQVTVDFAPLPKMHRKRIEEALRGALRDDPVETTVAGWTPLGHLELQRRRERRPLG